MSDETSSEIAAKLASLLHITQELPSMESSVKKRWEKAYGDTNTNVDGWLEGLFELALQAAEQAIDAICRFEGYKALYVTFARKSLQSLYIPSVQESRVDKCIIEPLNSVLAALIDEVPDDLRERVADGFLDATIHLWERVVLDGGPLRAFRVSDVEDMEADLSALQSFFIADGEGLDESHVQHRTRRLCEILTLMSLETDVLARNYESMKKQEDHQQHNTPARDPSLLFKILCHRADRDASKYLKNCGLPKRLRDNSQLLQFTVFN